MGDVTATGRILVTGATGFLGGQLIRSLMSSGVSVVGLGRDRGKLAQLGCDGIALDLAKPIDAATLPQIDAIVHCAARSSPFGRRKDFVTANVDATRNLVALAQTMDVKRLIHISTPSVYFAFRDQEDVGEDYPLPPPVNFYAETKAMGERIVLRALADRAIVLRPRGIFGAGDSALLPRLLRAAQARPLPRLRGGVASIDLTHVDDVVAAIISALTAPDGACGEVYNISGGDPRAIEQIVSQTCARAGITPRWRNVPLTPALMVAQTLETVARLRPSAPEPVVTRYGLGLFAYRQSLDLSKAKARLNWSPQVPFEDGLARTFEPSS